jgi:hypothetical protein
MRRRRHEPRYRRFAESGDFESGGALSRVLTVC